MKIISGFLKNKTISTAKESFRPSTGRFKEALFSILSSGQFSDFSFDKKNVLDLFCGSCLVGFETISRGANSCTFVDIEKSHLDNARIFASKNNISDKVKFLNLDSTNLSSSNTKYNFIFLDPPYGKAMSEKTLHSLHTNSWIENESLVIIEVGSHESVKIDVPFESVMERIYGKSKMIILRYLGGGNEHE